MITNICLINDMSKRNRGDILKFLHTADWHIGKKLHDFSLVEEQRSTFEQIEQIAKTEKVDAIVIAGDLYDRSVPSEEAVKQLNHMLIQLNLKDGFPLLAINGNHDSAIRLNAGSDWYLETNFYLKTQLKDAFDPVEIKDTQFFLLPYFEISAAREYFQDESIKTLRQAMKKIITTMQENFDPSKKHVLIAHFFAAGSSHVDSETTIEVGGLDAVPLDLMDAFDYVALGHLHSKNAVHHEKIKYSGSPVKFSVSEANDEKGVWIIDTDLPSEKMVKWIPLKMKNEIQILQESFSTLMDPKYYHQIPDDDFIAIELTDKEIIPNIMNRLREYYPKIISFKRKNGRVEFENQEQRDVKKADPLEMMQLFFEDATGHTMSTVQLDFAKQTLSQAKRNQ